MIVFFRTMTAENATHRGGSCRAVCHTGSFGLLAIGRMKPAEGLSPPSGRTAAMVRGRRGFAALDELGEFKAEGDKFQADACYCDDQEM